MILRKLRLVTRITEFSGLSVTVYRTLNLPIIQNLSCNLPQAFSAVISREAIYLLKAAKFSWH